MFFSTWAQETLPSISEWKSASYKDRTRFTPRTLINTGFAYDVMPLSSPGNADVAAWLENIAIKQIAEELRARGTG